MRRRKGAGEITTLDERREDALEQARLSSLAAEKAEEGKDEVAALEASGEIDAEEARRRYAEEGETIVRHRREVDRLERLAVKIGEDIARARYREARIEYEAALGVAGEACGEANKVAERLARALTSAANAATELEQKRRTRKTAISEARALCDAVGDLDFEHPENFEEPSWLPERDALEALLDLIADKRKERSRVQAKKAAEEQGKRERAAAALKKLVKEFAWSGDRDILEQIRALDRSELAIEFALAEAQKAHAAVRSRAGPAVDELLARVRKGRTSPSSALAELHRMANVPADLRAEASAELVGARRPAGAAA